MRRLLQSRAAPLFALAVLTAAAFLPAVSGNGFVSLDDGDYLTGNPMVQQGLSLRGLRWAFTTFTAANWHPLTWLSHMLDWQLFGARPWGHHAVSVALHAASAMVLFLLLDEGTGDRVRSLLVAALFAVHPLRVESVAWASERKDVLCTLFFLCACRAHLRRGRTAGWALLALLCKPMAVTLPLALLLLDVWPLQRAGKERLAALVLEKWPLFALSAASSAVTLVAQVSGGSVSGLAQITLPMRLGGAAVNVARYLLLTFRPVNLIPFYPLETPHAAEVGAALCLISAITILAAVSFPKRPALLVGWAWFLVTLVPVIGLVQVGTQSVADRYSYLPHVGLLVALVWALPQLAQPALAALALLLAGMTFAQARLWRDTETLFSHTLRLSPGNQMAEVALATVRSSQGRLDEAEQLLLDCVRRQPGWALPHVNLASVLLKQGHTQEAAAVLAHAHMLAPRDAEVTAALTLALAQAGRLDEALAAVRELPQDARAPLGAGVRLGVLLDQAGRGPEALELLSHAAAVDPSDAAAREALGVALARRGRFKESLQELAAAARLKPDEARLQDLLRKAREDAAR